MVDYLAIIKRNFLTPIVVAIFLLAGALIYVKEYRDAWFISVVIVVNSLIGVFQEIRAQRALKKLELMSRPRARAYRNGKWVEVDYLDLKVGDEIELKSGDEVPADAKISQTRGLEVDESILTGEAVAIDKKLNQTIYSATTILSGSARAIVTAVGDDSKAGKISKNLKRYRPEITPLQKIIRNIISGLTFGAIGLAVLIFVVYYFSGQDSVRILKTITSGAVTVVPEGLLLASSLLLAFGALRLAQVKVLPQKLSAIEAMGLLNLLCVDKTGTLTSDKMELNRLESFADLSVRQLKTFTAIVAREASGNNTTGEAIVQGLELPSKYEIKEVMMFSSTRKMSGVRLVLDGRASTLLMGAPESIERMASLDEADRAKVDKWTSQGQRVLLLAEITDQKMPLKELEQNNGKVLGAVILDNTLRDGAKETIEFLQNQGVGIRVISGDNPKTVQYVAKQVGIKNPDKVVTGAELAKMSEADFNVTADNCVVFSRVLPEQKERLIDHFRSRGFFTGMVGDGVNDALALKKANLGVAMHAGAVASRRVSDIILLNNSFTSLPIGMRLGNQIMQAIEVIAALFFHKIIYGVILLLSTLVLGMVYPFAPRHITFMNIFLVTMPTIMWTLFPPLPTHRINPRHFWRDVLRPILPIATMTGLAVTFTYWAMSSIYVDEVSNVATMTVLTATFFGVYMVFLVDRIFALDLNRRSVITRIIYMVLVVLVVVISFRLGFLRDFFDFTTPKIWMLWPALGVIIVVAMVQWKVANYFGKKHQDNNGKT